MNMEKGLDIVAFLERAEQVPVVDVRTPAEFRQGHIPGAVNIPLFSDEERARVGRTYKQAGKEEAVILGLEYAGPKMKELASHASRLAVNGQLLLYCWRGGMRSASMAWLFETTGLITARLEGGYKSFRRHALAYLEKDFPFIVVGGLTGSGKTEILQALGKMGEQVFDLERRAHHKGSAFGALGENPQNTNEQFENELFSDLSEMNPSLPIWVEDESRTIGKNTLPAGIHRNIRQSHLIFLEVPLEDRIRRLVKDYARFPKKDLRESVEKIRPRLGDQNARAALEGIDRGDFALTAEIVLRYYDKTYRYGLDKRSEKYVHCIRLEKANQNRQAAGIVRKFTIENGLMGQGIMNR
jgi:tRNA 2-selenouridine synthase